MVDVREKRVVVVGLARSGVAAAQLAEKLGARVTVTDLNPRAAIENFAGERVLGANPPELAERADLVVTSPGVPITNGLLQRARARAVPVWSEIEFAWRHLATPAIAITGTAGKSTTVALVGEMMRRSGLRAYVGGNIGAPLSLAAPPLDWLVVEVSSFQLETVDEFRPKVAAILNLSENHLDRHGDMATYAALKARLVARQGAGDACVLGGDDRWTAAIAPPDGVVEVRLRAPFAERFRAAGEKLDASTRKLPGAHNLANIQFAANISLLAGATCAAIQQTIAEFAGLPHRLELVREWRSIRFYNDSKATTVDSVLRSLDSFTAPVIWIAGGRDKGGDWSRVARRFETSPVKAALLIGEAAPLIARAAGGEACGDLARAFARAIEIARPGDVVVLSPGCASYDQFVDFEDRGARFKALVGGLAP